MAKSDNYWINRSNKRMATYHKDSDVVIAKITEAYSEAIKSIDDDIKNIFTNYQISDNLTPAKARRLLNSKIPNPLFNLMKNILPKIKDENIRKVIISRLNAKAYKARISRLEALKESIYLNTRVVADVELRESRKLYVKNIKEAYYRNCYDIQKGIGLGFNVATMPVRVVEEMLKNPWSSVHYSDRVWRNVDTMTEQLEKVITSGVMTGKSYRRMSRELEELSEDGIYAAERLIRTEMTYFTNQAELQSYKECGIDKYIFVATLDSRTSKPCRKMDRKMVKISEAVIGENLPPLHPWCRSTTRIGMDDGVLATMQRRARNPETGKTYFVPTNMSYSEWKDKFIDKVVK